METVKFRPLRFEKKSGLIKVAGYQQWRKVKTADYHPFNLNIDDLYRTLPDNELVYNHKGQELFWYDYEPIHIKTIPNWASITKTKEVYTNIRNAYMYSCRGLDCDGVPAFSHNTADEIWTFKDLDKYEPLTVKTVRLWTSWFLYNLNNRIYK